MDVFTAPIIRGKNNEVFYIRTQDADGTVHYTSEFGIECDWIAYVLPKRADDWEVSSHLAMVTAQY